MSQTAAPAEASLTTLERLLPKAALLESDAIARHFPSEQALEWFVRQHRAQLFEQAAAFRINGRLVFDPDRFAAVVLQAGRRCA